MKLLDVLILVFASLFLMIGVHQGLQFGWGNSYFFFMFSVGLVFLYSYRRQQRVQAEEEEPQKPKGTKRTGSRR
ncbi:MAG TPA: hypothetical protein DCE41_15775 [Cytophagales bacterium]|nr:hypothetical protein [Cytophagales bacterium]HAA23380.1 hypothetical protein [Cytophagales bacterium]HAP58140.1 hypothetical protein [Cytophagales bacterium]